MYLETFKDAFGSLLLATIGVVIGSEGLLFFAIVAESVELAPWRAWLTPGSIWPYGIAAILCIAGATTLLQATFFPAAYCGIWLDEPDSPCLPIAVVDSFLCIFIQISFLVFGAGLLSMIGGAIIAALLQSEEIGWSTAEGLASGLKVMTGALFLCGAVGLFQWLAQPDDPGEADENGGEE